MIAMSSAESIAPPNFPSANMHVWIIYEFSYFISGAQIIYLTYSTAIWPRTEPHHGCGKGGAYIESSND